MKQNTSHWTYRRLHHILGVEASDWLGTSSPSLSPHFHDETQVSVVYSGHRLFQIGRQFFNVLAGQFAVIPAGTPHCSHGLGCVPTKSRDIFVDPARCFIEEQSAILIGSVADIRDFDESKATEEVLLRASSNKLVGQKLTLGNSLPADLFAAVRESDLSIEQIAACSSLIREGFIRKFARELGMTPNAYRIAYRATRARSLLRRRLPPAAAAYECGFADQSHLGRVFRKNFGTTPAVYRRAWLG